MAFVFPRVRVAVRLHVGVIPPRGVSVSHFPANAIGDFGVGVSGKKRLAAFDDLAKLIRPFAASTQLHPSRLSCDNLESIAGYPVSDRRNRISLDLAICGSFSSDSLLPSLIGPTI